MLFHIIFSMERQMGIRHTYAMQIRSVDNG